MFHVPRRHAMLAVLSALCLTAPALGDDVDREAQLEAALRKKTASVTTDYCEDLDKVSVWAAKQGLRSDAIAIYKRIHSLDPEYAGLPKLKDAIKGEEKAQEDADLTKVKEDLAERLVKVDEKHAKRLFDFAGQCFKYGLFSRSYDLLHRVLELAPDPKNREQSRARDVLGYEWDKETGTWITDWEFQQKKKNFLTEEGWVEKKNRKKWEAGERLYKGKWVSIEEEKRIRSRNEYNPFLVESENFVVKCNLGRKEAWQYALLLEDFKRAFLRTFIGFFEQDAGGKLLFKLDRLGSKHVVVVFPSRADYLTHVKAEKGNEELLRESAGFYSSGDRFSRFYWSENIADTLETLYHETTHQLLAEMKVEASGGSQGNNWVVEGIASYIETWTKVDGEWHPGANTKHDRLLRAKQYVASADTSFLPSFVRLEYDQFHKTDRGLNYALSAAFCHFLLHYDDERYKEGFIRFLSAYYGGKVKEDSILEYVGHSNYGELEKQFREYMAAL